jgi:hypothetical protein
LTAPENILDCVSAEYNQRTQQQQGFRKDKDAEIWLRDLECAVLVPLRKVSAEQREHTEAFILTLLADTDRLADIVCVGDGWAWHYALMDTLCWIIRVQADNCPDKIRQHVSEMVLLPAARLSPKEIMDWFDEKSVHAPEMDRSET